MNNEIIDENKESMEATSSNTQRKRKYKTEKDVISSASTYVKKVSLSDDKKTNIIDSENKKRKIVSIRLTLSDFMKYVQQIFINTIIDEGRSIHFDKPLEKYIISEESQILPLNNNNTTVLNKTDNTKLSVSFRWYITLMIIKELYKIAEIHNIILLFPKEALKYFLATYYNFIKVDDLIDTNKSLKPDKKTKSTSMPNGSVLCEYTKGFDIFINNMSKYDSDDIKALRFIINNKIQLSPKIYNICHEISVKPHEYNVDKTDIKRNDYVQIIVTNFKHAIVLVTSNIIMIYDGYQFIVPSLSIDKDLTTKLLHNSNLQKHEYLLLDVMLIKNRVIDILDMQLNNNIPLPLDYNERLKLITDLLPSIKTVNINTNVNALQDVSYIQKKKYDFGPSYIYNKLHITAAAVGISEKNILLAFKENNNTLVYKTKAIISGPLSCMITTVPYQCVTTVNGSGTNDDNNNILNNQTYTISLGDVVYTLNQIEPNVHLFKHVIPIELKDQNKLGNLSKNPISKIIDYKPQTTTKDIGLFDNFKKHLEQDAHEHELMDILTSMVKNTSFATPDMKQLMSRLMTPDIHIDPDVFV